MLRTAHFLETLQFYPEPNILSSLFSSLLFSSLLSSLHLLFPLVYFYFLQDPYLHNDLHLRDGPPNWPGGNEAWRAQEPINAHSHLISMLLGKYSTYSHQIILKLYQISLSLGTVLYINKYRCTTINLKTIITSTD